MKKIFIYFTLSLFLVSCEKFLESDPENEISSDIFLSSESDLEIYSNGFLENYMPHEETLAWGDQHCDNVATRSSTEFLIGNNWTADDQENWGDTKNGKWAQLRDVNYFLDNMVKAKDNVSDEIYRHYEGVGRYWRAYFYFDMVKQFGDVPWYDHEIDYNDTEALYKARDSREYVMDKVLEDLDYATENCSSESKFVNSSTKITKWVALAFKSRVCLFEGTYRKYHTDLGLTSSAEKFLREAIKASEELMKDSPYALYNSGNIKTQYRSLFNSTSLNATEVILGKACKTDVKMTAITWKLFSGSFGNNWSLTKDFVNQFLMLDGSRFTDKAGYQTMTFNQEFDNRDYRLQQIVISPEYQRMINGVKTPYAPNFAMTRLGYHCIKWALDDDKYDGVAKSNNSLPMFRYAEVLLNYAEAKAEMGEMNETVWNKTIRPLRERAGVVGSAPQSYDPYLASYYRNQTTDKWILEVRRERSIELALEMVRPDDLMRWKLGELFAARWYGIYIPQKNVAYDLNNDGISDVAVVDQYPASTVPGVVYIVLDNTYRLSEGDHGYIEYGFNLGRLWQDRKYLRPIPTKAIQINPNLLPQNPGW